MLLQAWLRELRDVGFCGHRAARDIPATLTSIDQLADLVSKVIYTLTGLHAATHYDALDLYGFMPSVPAMMRRAPPTSRDIAVSRDGLSATLPDQFPDAYYTALAFNIQVHKSDEVTHAFHHAGSCWVLSVCL